MRPKVTIVACNLSTNSANRCWRLAQSLAHHYEVEIVGTTFGVKTNFGVGLWPPLVGLKNIPVRFVRGRRLPGYIISILALLRIIDGDVIIACKPRFSSLGVTLLHKLIWRRPLILDIDDDELAQTRPGKKLSWKFNLLNVESYFWTRVIHPLHRFVDAKLVVSENFRVRYGGTIVPHPMDSGDFDPARYDRTEIRRSLGISSDRIVVGFIGSPSSQKGTDLLSLVPGAVTDPRVLILIVGAELGDSYTEKMKMIAGDQLLLLPPQPLARLPSLLAAVDIVALPQRCCDETWGQMPAKLTDAMAMGKVVIASNRADIGMYLAQGRGVSIEADNPEALIDGVKWLLANREQWEPMGRAARKYFLEHLTTEIVGEDINRAIRHLFPRSRAQEHAGAVGGAHE